MANSCVECEEAIHVYFVKKGDERLKLLQQAQCAKCWRPLYYDSRWPGTHESLRPPFHSTLQPLKLSVADCGHIFHTPCTVSDTSHCPLCFIWIQTLRPLHYHITAPPTAQTRPHHFEAVLEEANESKQRLQAEMADLKKQVSELSSEVENLQRQLSRKPWFR